MNALNAAAVACLLALLPLAGCSGGSASMRDAIPIGEMATPWVLVGEVWEGDLIDAIDATGEDGARWLERGARRVHLAKYVHRDHPVQRLTLRVFEFPDGASAREACAAARPAGAEEYRCGDSGFWTDDGVTCALGPHVLEVFGEDGEMRTQLAAAYLAGIVASRRDSPSASEN